MPQTEIAAALGCSASSVSELLNGRRRKPPEWEAIRRIVGLCARRNGPGAAPAGMNLDVSWWRERHAELERRAEAAGPARQQPQPSRSPSPVRPFVPPADLAAADCTNMTVDLAMQILADGRPRSMYPADHPWATTHDDHVLRFLDELLAGFPRRVRACRGLGRTALLHAARVVLVAAAKTKSELDSEEEEEHASGLIEDLSQGHYTALAYVRAGDDGHRSSAASPPASTAPYRPSSGERRFLDAYRELATPLAAACPEFTLMAGLPGAVVSGDPAERPGTGLTRLGALLAEFAGRDVRSAGDLARLRVPIASLDAPGPRLPGLAEGYVNPRFRLAGPYGPRAGFASDKWWRQQPSYDTIECFLSVHLLSAAALLSPLLVLGHPGAGKSLLTRLLSARLPQGEFRPLRVELRHAPAEADVQTQLEHALRQATGRSMSWPDWSEQDAGAVPVVLLDGFDELLQAGAQRLDTARQWNYLAEVEAFQQREAGLGRPLIVIVTSRTVVADRAEIPFSSQVIRLEPFDAPEIERWLSVWQRTNEAQLAQRGLRPLTLEVALRHRSLAAHPLLLLMLALYDAVDNALHRLGAEDISRTQLYDRLLTEFVRRQVDKHGALPPSEQDRAVSRELHHLSVIALGMFHRGAQAISGEEADRDLLALGTPTDRDEHGGSGLLFGRFFFVHEAQAVVAEERLRSYEFLHATFGEHLAARLIEQALRRLVAGRGGGALDDGELYALLSFAPLTDRAQLMENLRDMLAVWPAGGASRDLPALAAELLHASEWEPVSRSELGHAPTRVTRTYRNAVYEVNLVLLGVMTADVVYASEFFGTDALVDHWQRRTAMWRSQLSEESWELFTSALTVDRCWLAPSDGAVGQRPDLRISTRSKLSVDHDLGWVFGAEDATLPWPAALDRGAASDLAESLSRQVTFLANRHAELLLHAVRPLLRRMPSALLTYQTDGVAQLETAAHSLIGLLTRHVYTPAGLPHAYDACLDVIGNLPPDEAAPYLEAVSRQLVHDIPAMPDKALVSVLRGLRRCLADQPLTPAAHRTLVDCVHEALGRADQELGDVLTPLAESLARYGQAQAQASPVAALLSVAGAGRATGTWQWCDMPRGDQAREQFDRILDELDLTLVAARHPGALIDLLRIAAELGLTDWLTARAGELLDALPAAALGLLRPSDVRFLRAVLPAGSYGAEFAEVERIWR